MERYFYALCDGLETQLQADEIYLVYFQAEISDFVRFNQAKIRQAGTVIQRQIELTLIYQQRQTQASLQLSGDINADHQYLTKLVQQCRQHSAHLPVDPYLLINETVHSSEFLGKNVLIDGQSISHNILKKVENLDFVGHLSNGSTFYGFANTFGQRNWHSRYSFNLDWSVYDKADKAIKSAYAGFRWDEAVFAQKIAENRQQLPILKKPAHSIKPGYYRVYLAPAALEEILSLTMSGVSLKEHKTKTSCLLRLWAQQQSLHSALTLRENTADGIAPHFQSQGFIKPERVTLIQQGAAGELLVSPRSAKEYGVATNAANEEESPENADVDAGDLPQADVLRALDTGIYINNLWYLNFSDRAAARITGMTRFATFWVENGKIVAPLNVMRFDDSLFNLLGDQLEALTQAREWLLSTNTYEQRDNSSARLPGALIKAMHFTL